MNLAEEMKKRNMTEEHLMEYMLFEDECVKKGFTFNSLIRAREKETPKKPTNYQNHYYPESREYSYTTAKCPLCKKGLLIDECSDPPFYCQDCGQRLDWGEDE